MPRITLVIASLHVLLLMALVVPIIATRLRQRIDLGDGGDAAMLRRLRVQGNFIEYVPIALVLLAMLEFAGLPAPWLWGFGGTLFIARVLHAYGLGRTAGTSPGRLLGTLLTFSVLIAMAAAGLWIGLR